MRYKKIMMLTIVLACLVAVSAVSAAENATDDLISVDVTDGVLAVSATSNQTDDASIVEEDSFENVIDDSKIMLENNFGSNDDVLSVSFEKDLLSSNSFFETGSLGYIESEDRTMIYKKPIGYTIRLVGSDVSNQEVFFSVYKSKSGANVGDYESITDENGYAKLNANLKEGEYSIYIGTDYHGSVYNSLNVVNKNVFKPELNVFSTYYHYFMGKIEYKRYGHFEGYFKLYKGKNLITSKHIIFNDADKYNRFVYSTKKLSRGSYTVKIESNSNKVIAQSSFKVSKIPSNIYCKSIKSNPNAKKYITAEIYDFNGDDCSGIVTFKINKKKYNVKIKKGVAKLKIKIPSKIGSYSCKIIYKGNKFTYGCSSNFKIVVKKTTTAKSVTLKVRYSDNPVTKKLSNGDVISTTYEKVSGRQFNPGVYALVTHGFGLLEAKYTKLVKCTVWFKNSQGKVVTKSSSNFQYNWFIKVNLVKGYAPYKAKIWYKNK